MALIEIQHVVADQYPVDPETNPSLLEGKIVEIGSGGYIEAADANEAYPLGIAGDSTTSTTNAGGSTIGGTPYSAALIINGAGATQGTQNRVSDFFNESLASGKITVYHSGGKFASDQVDASVAALTPGAALGCAASGEIKAYASGAVIGVVTKALGAWESGVVGTDVNGSLSLGDYVEFKLMI